LLPMKIRVVDWARSEGVRYPIRVKARMLAEGRRRADTRGVDLLDPWVRARVAWVFVVFVTLPASGLLWLAGGYAFCGTDTTKPGKFGDWACDTVVRPVAPWLLTVATPLMLLVAGGHLAIQRKSWRLFGFSVIGAPSLLVIGFFTLTAIF
jgi:hypothetical protein